MSLRPKRNKQRDARTQSQTTKSGKKVRPKKERMMVTAFHGTSSKIVKMMRDSGKVYGYFVTDTETTQEYAWRGSERHKANPVIVEVQITEKRFENSWVASAHKMLGITPYASDLRLKWADVVAIWRWDTKNNEWKRREIKH